MLAYDAVCAAQPVIEIGSRRELFVDKYLVAELDNLSLQMHTPQLAHASASPTENGAFCTVIYDKEKGVYHYYYRVAFKDPGQSEHFQTAYFYMVSKDGINWHKPDLGLFPEYGMSAKNMILKPEDPISHNFSPFLDMRPGVVPEERFKAVAGATGIWSSGKGLYGFVSADGVHWRKLQEEPIFPQEIAGEHTEDNNYFDSQNVVFWSESENLYVCYYRTTWLPEPRGWFQSLRGISRSTSPDFIHWTQGVEMPVNLPEEQFYTNQTSPYFRTPHIYIALPWRYFPPLPGNIHNYPSDTVLMTARGSGNYDRTFTKAFIRPGLDPAYWIKTGRPRGIATALNVVPTGNTEMSIYQGENRYTLRLDGFASLNSDSIKYGRMTTKPFIFSGEVLEINYSTSVAGRIFIEIQEEQGRPIPGYALDDCEVIIGDEIARAVRWTNGQDVSALAGKSVRLHVKMRDADLYSFVFHEPEADVPVAASATSDQVATARAEGFSYEASGGQLPSEIGWVSGEVDSDGEMGVSANVGIVSLDSGMALHIVDQLESRDSDLPLYSHGWGDALEQKALLEHGMTITMVYQCNATTEQAANGFVILALGGTAFEEASNIASNRSYYIWDLASYAARGENHTLVIVGEPVGSNYNFSFSIDGGPSHALKRAAEKGFSGAFGFGAGASKGKGTNMYVMSVAVESNKATTKISP